MNQPLDTLNTILAEIDDLLMASAVLSWDQQTNMPQGGAEDRGNQIATLSRLAHDRFTSDEVGRLLEDLKPLAEALDPDSHEACLIRVTHRDYHKQTKIPSDFVAEFARATVLAESTWEEARRRKDFTLFRPHLEKIVTLRRQYAGFFAPYDHVYDPLLDDFEPGMKTREVQAIFGALRGRQVALVEAISRQPQVDDAFLHIPYDEKAQWDFGIHVITRIGYDWNRGRLDKSAHPFTTAFGYGDVRITTRFDPERGMSALFSTMHEAGHALYDQGIPTSLRRSPLGNGASMAVHESQSRMWENLVGRSHSFWEYFYPRLREVFPSQLGNVSLQQFYRAINKVERSPIRVEADEATYNLHIMLRMELEIALMEGSLSVVDLPQAWNTRMQEYLRIKPRDDAEGVLQDIHWSGGSFGYFPTYALGNLVSAQLWQTLTAQHPELTTEIANGKFDTLLGWLRANIHMHGAKYEPQDLIAKVTGSHISPLPYLDYLEKKYSEIYGI